MYKHLFGPVPSRRLGMSLGIDLIPHKICSLNCVYCECGGTTTLTRERKEYVPVEEVYDELKDYFKHHPDPDYFTFSGAGEPTLHLHIGEVIAFLKEVRPGIPVAVLSNGTLFGDPEVRADLLQADLVLPSLDAATEEAFSFILPKLPLPIIGAIDLMEEDDAGTIIVTDFKTSGKAYSVSEIDQNQQLTTYQMAIRKQGYSDREILLRIDCLIKTQKPKFEQYYSTRSEIDEIRLTRKIHQVWDGIKKGVFVPNDTSWKCKNCGYKSACNDWFLRRAA